MQQAKRDKKAKHAFIIGVAILILFVFSIVMFSCDRTHHMRTARDIKTGMYHDVFVHDAQKIGDTLRYELDFGYWSDVIIVDSVRHN